MRVLLINPEEKTTEPPRHVPYGMLQLAALADELGYQCQVLDNNIFRLPPDAICNELRKGWDLIGIGGNTYQYSVIKNYISLIDKEVPDAVIVGGGPFVTSAPFQVMKWLPKMDVGVVGESYITWPEVLETADHFHDWRNNKGVIYRQGQKIKLSKPQAQIENTEYLDGNVPFPAYDHNVSGVETYLMYSQLPYAAECFSPQCRRLDVMTGYGKARHSPNYIVGLIEKLRKKYCINFVSFTDSNILSDAKWFDEFSALYAKADMPAIVRWGTYADVRTFDINLLPKARDVGCRYVYFMNSFKSQEECEANMPKMAASIKATQSVQINPLINWEVGYSDTTREGMVNACRFLIDNQIHVTPSFHQPSFEEISEQHGTMQYLTSAERKLSIRQAGPDISILLERLAMSLTTENQLSVNLTLFSDAQLAGLRYLLTTDGFRLANKEWDLQRINQENYDVY